MSNTFLNTFNGFLDFAIISDAIKESIVEEISVNSERRTVELVCRFNKIEHSDSILKAEQAIAAAMSLSCATIEPRFPGECFSADCYGDVVEILKKKSPAMSGIFMDSTARYENGVLSIALQNGGADIIESSGTKKEIKLIIKTRYGIDVEVELSGKTQLFKDSEEYETMMQEAERQLVEEELKRQKEKELERRRQEESVEDFDESYPIIEGSEKHLYGRDRLAKTVPISSLAYDTGAATVWGDVFGIEIKETRDGRNNIITFNVTDYTGSYIAKIFDSKERCRPVIDCLNAGDTVIVGGDIREDRYSGEYLINVLSLFKARKYVRRDNAPRKRVELHLHTTLSQMDGVSSPESLVKCAANFGHKAVAITDHGVLQAYPEACSAAKKAGIKLIYG
ncbi:MAG: PHP domain-containing protein, partial [Clostridia bacterium]|nr:PHP domain-containing protein [Clostridia bacterium]